MSRSIHDTYKVAWRAQRRAQSTGDERDFRRAAAARANIDRLRAIKLRLREQRSSDALPPTGPGELTIQLRDERPEVIHAVSEADLRAMIARLPPGRVDGLATIELCLGGDDRTRSALTAWTHGTCDPLTGQPGDEVLPGVFLPPVRGIYRPRLGTLRLHAAVCVEPPSPAVMFFLRLAALSTFVHELAHHFDAAFRTRGDRWRMDDVWRVEAFARAVAFDHVVTYVVPYVTERYPAERAAFDAWIAELVGFGLPAEVLVDDRVDGGHWVEDGFFAVVRAAAGGEPTPLDRLALDLHRAGYDEHAGRLAAAIHAADPDSTTVPVLRAEIAASVGDLAGAEALLRAVLARSPDHQAALRELVDVLRRTARWDDIAALTAGHDSIRLLVDHVRAAVIRADWDTARAGIARLRELRRSDCADVFTAWIACRAGDHRAALTLIARSFALGAFAYGLRTEGHAIRCEAASALGELQLDWRLSQDTREALQRAGHAAWAAALPVR